MQSLAFFSQGKTTVSDLESLDSVVGMHAGLRGGCGFYANTVIMGHLAAVDEWCLPHTGLEMASFSHPHASDLETAA